MSEEFDVTIVVNESSFFQYDGVLFVENEKVILDKIPEFLNRCTSFY